MRKLIITLMVLTLLLGACNGVESSFENVSQSLGDSGGSDDGADFAPEEAARDTDELLAFDSEVLDNRKIIQEAFRTHRR